MRKDEIISQLENLKVEHSFRKLRIPDKNIIDLSSNDYLGLANNENLKNEFYKKYKPKLSSSSSRLITGSYEEVMNLEKRAQEIYKKPCIMFNSGYDANSSIIETFYNKDSLILTDRLNHASIYDGIISSKATFHRYKHLDLEHLESLLNKYKDQYDDILVVTESVYSMDGDIVDIEKLVNLKEKYKFDLLIDEAHSYGVFGYGMVHNLKLIEKVDFLVIPLGKGGASVGAMVICNELYKEYIINKSRKFIYSTALPPVVHCWNLFILENMNKFDIERAKLEFLKNHMLKKLNEFGLKTSSTSHIISIIIGENKKINEIADEMKHKGYLLHPIKEPTVPHGTARFRIGLNPNLTVETVDKFIEELKNEINRYI